MSSFYTPVPLNLSRELFHQTYLTSPHYLEGNLLEGVATIFILMDYMVGIMRLPYLLIEVQRIQKIVDQGATFQNSSELRYQTLSLMANTLEIFIWGCDKKWLQISKRKGRVVQSVSTFSRMVLYEQAVRKEFAAFIDLYRQKWVKPEIGKELRYKHLKVSLISHTAFLGWVSLQFISLTRGVLYPKPFLKMLHVASVSFGFIAMGYDRDSEVNQFFRRLAKQLPTGEIYH